MKDTSWRSEGSKLEIRTSRLQLQSKGENDIMDLTSQIAEGIAKSGLKEGFVNIFVSGSTGAVTTIEYEDGLLRDFPAMLERLAPRDENYEHEKRWHDGNGHSHVRASLVGPSLTVPFQGSRLLLGSWQQIVFLELDTRSRRRELVLQIVGSD
jgi:secondary thiamine-phosphate synthase enzyme